MNVAISFQRSETRKPRVIPADASLFETIPQRRDEPADDRLTLIHQLIERLDPPNRALMLLYLDDYAYAEIAKILGISEKPFGRSAIASSRRARVSTPSCYGAAIFAPQRLQ